VSIYKEKAIKILKGLKDKELSNELIDEIVNLPEDIVQDMEELSDILYEQITNWYEERLTQYYLRVILKVINKPDVERKVIDK